MRPHLPSIPAPVTAPTPTPTPTSTSTAVVFEPLSTCHRCSHQFLASFTRGRCLLCGASLPTRRWS